MLFSVQGLGVQGLMEGNTFTGVPSPCAAESVPRRARSTDTSEGDSTPRTSMVSDEMVMSPPSVMPAVERTGKIWVVGETRAERVVTRSTGRLESESIRRGKAATPCKKIRIVIDLMTSGRKLKASRKGSK